MRNHSCLRYLHCCRPGAQRGRALGQSLNLQQGIRPLIVSLINIFVGSGLLSWVVTIVALPLFLGLVIWETKEVKEEAQEAAAIGDTKAAWSIGIIGAVGLYLSFLNIFLILLRLLDWFNGD